jgi:hypothetical protein
MNRRLPHSFAIVAVPMAAVLLAATTCAEPPEGPPRDGPPPHGPADRLRAALDANGDHELDAGEIEAASRALKTLDEDGNGRIDRHEFRPPLPPRPGDGGGRGLEGRPPRAGGPEFRRPRDGSRPEGPAGERPPRERPAGPPREGAGPRGRGPGAGPSPERFVERAMSFDADGDGKLDRDELGTFAAEMRERMRGPAAERDAE